MSAFRIFLRKLSDGNLQFYGRWPGPADGAETGPADGAGRRGADGVAVRPIGGGAGLCGVLGSSVGRCVADFCFLTADAVERGWVWSVMGA